MKSWWYNVCDCGNIYTYITTLVAPPHNHCCPTRTPSHSNRPGLHINSTVDVWVGELYRAAKLIAVNTTNLHGVELLRFVPTEGASAPNPHYYQTIQGLMNITSPQAGGRLWVRGSSVLGLVM